MKLRDLTGMKFGKLTVICLGKTKIDASGRKRVTWLCICECGVKKDVQANCLTSGNTKTCGCARLTSIGNTRHGKRWDKVYNAWLGMKDRCQNKNAPQYHGYGARGITVCKRWQIFNNFYEDMGDPPKNYSLDRINNNKGYSKKNCRWASKETQMNNTRANKFLTVDGKKYTLAQASRVFNVKYSNIRNRIKLGWTDKQILELVKR